MHTLRQVLKRPWFWAVVVVLLGAAVWRLSWTPEWRIQFGDAKAREQAAKEIWAKNDRRAVSGLRRLFQDPEPAVRAAALKGAMRHYRQELIDDVATLTHDSDPTVVDLAWLYLTTHECARRDEWAARLGEELAKADPGAISPNQAFYFSVWTLDRQEAPPEWLFPYTLEHPGRDLAGAWLRYPDKLRPHRQELVGQLDSLRGTPRWDFAIAALTAIDGCLRGYAAADWRGHDGEAAAPVADDPGNGFVVEAEWAYDIRPNFQIDTWQGETAVVLAEGAGGYMSWLQQEDSTVDVGTARFRFGIAKAGYYTPWVRIWMDNKCSNSTGITIDGTDLTSFDDHTDIFDQWVWERQSSIYLREGRHTLDLQALEDGVSVDKYAVLPSGKRPTDAGLDRSCLYDSSLVNSISFTPQMQHQLRGTTQEVRVWVRRSTPELKSVDLEVTVPPPFRLVGDRPDLANSGHFRVDFPPDQPLAGTTLLVTLAADAVGGEVEVTVAATADGKQVATGRLTLGVHYDWYTTGPLSPYLPRVAKLKRERTIDRETVLKEWKPYPAEGYDRYRRLCPEYAYGQAQDKIIFLYTEIDVAEEGDYLNLLSCDDDGWIWIDGKYFTGRDAGGPAEGKLVMNRRHLTAGRHHVLACIYQADFADPEGEDALRHTPNNWVFKWLLRKSRHEIAPGITGAPLRR